MNISGILVMAKPERHVEVVGALGALPGVEIHQVDEASGRIIAVQEAEDINAEVAGVRQIKALPGVMMAEMVYHYIADDDSEYDELPPDLVQQGEGEACAVPAYLND
jgi:periplasmic nitrate reductase NapD